MQGDKVQQRKLDDAVEACDTAQRNCRSFWADEAAHTPILFGKHEGLSYMELFHAHSSYVEWVIDQTEAVGRLARLRKWLIRASAVESRYHETRATLNAMPRGLVPTWRLRVSTARGQIAELNNDLLECVVRHGDLGGYLRLVSTCKVIAAALRFGRVHHVAALATARNFQCARRCLGVPANVEVADRAELERVGELVRLGLCEDLRALSLSMSIAHPEFTRKRTALRRATTIAEYAECSDERLLTAKAAARVARDKVTAVVGAFHQLCAQRELRFVEVPAEPIKSDATFKKWVQYMEDLQRHCRTAPMTVPQQTTL